MPDFRSPHATRPLAWRAVCVAVAVVASVLLITPPSPAGDRADPTPADDRSLTTGEYADRGVPDVARPWGPAEYKKAHQALAALAKADPRRLPRFGSPRSGKVFDRIVAPENFDGIADKTATHEQRHALFRGYAGVPDLVVLYVKANAAGVGAFDGELVEQYAQVIRLHLAGARWGAEFIATIPADDPTRAERLQALAGIRAPGAKSIRDFLQAFASAAFRKTELLRFAETLRTLVPQYAAFLPAETRGAIAHDLNELEAAEQDRDLRSALHDVYDALIAVKTPAVPAN